MSVLSAYERLLAELGGTRAGASAAGRVWIVGPDGQPKAVDVRIGSPLFSHVLFGVYVGLVVWGGLYLRDARLRALFPLKDTN